MTNDVTDTNVGKMTEEEAIAELKKAQESNSLTEYPSNESLGVAIEALRFQRSVVRCKDCGHRILKTWADICKFSDEWAIDEDGYCHRGVRRNEE